MRRLLVVAGLACVAAAVVGLTLLLDREPSPPARAPTAPPRTPPPRPTAPPEAPTEAAPEPPPAELPVIDPPWDGAGAFVWNETDVSPEQLAATMRERGFAWLALRLHDGLSRDPVEGDWITRFRAAGGPPVGGWGVLRDSPEAEAELAAALLRQHGLGFYVANAEAEYGATGDPGRSGRFVASFRRLLPALPAALSSLCRPEPSFDLAAWRDGGFAFLPQAYVNQFGSEVAPASCLAAASHVFSAGAVHPTVGTFVTPTDIAAGEYARLLAQAGTRGFSLYLAEADMRPEEWTAFGQAIAELGIAAGGS
jgi:hypothetical protein